MTILEQLQIWQDELRELEDELGAGSPSFRPEMKQELLTCARALSSAQQTVTKQSIGQKIIPRARHSERKIDLSVRSYIETNIYGVIRRTNNATALLLNFPRHLIVGQPLLVFVKKAERTAFLTAFQELRYGAHADRYEYLVMMKPVGMDPRMIAVIAERVEDQTRQVLGITWILAPR